MTNTTLAGAPIARFFDWLHLHQVEGLPWSATGGLSYARIPRGCALSFLSIYIGRFEPEEGARIYGRYREAQGIDWLGWRGFREWPLDEEDRGMDVDSGPVIFGWGMAATGIGLGAARLYDDRAMAAGIERMADTVGGAVPLSGRYLLAPTLGQAMLFSGETMTPWDGPRPRCPPSVRRAPSGPSPLAFSFCSPAPHSSPCSDAISVGASLHPSANDHRRNPCSC